MKTPLFVSFCTMLVATLLAMHAFFKDSFSPADSLKLQIVKLQKEKLDADLKTQLVAAELADYQQSVATLIPTAAKGKSDAAAYPLRQLASVAAQGSATLEIERGSGIFENAKVAFREKDYEESNKLLTSLLDRYPASEHVPEAQFLLAESEFQLKDYSESVNTIEKMVTVYPENELTGYALMRLGKIFEIQNRLEDAGDIYRAVLANFKQPGLQKQAGANLKAVEL